MRKIRTVRKESIEGRVRKVKMRKTWKKSEKMSAVREESVEGRVRKVKMRKT